MPDSQTNVQHNIASLMKDVIRTALDCGRNPNDIRLLAASKTVSEDWIRNAVLAGIRRLGENYIQEAQKKIKALAGLPVEWHFIGHLQTNKTGIAIRLFDLIHTVDSFRLARELDRQAAKSGKVQKILLQVNISGEKTKSGVDPTAIMALATEISELDHIAVKGLMTMPPFFDDPEQVRPYFKALHELSRCMAQAAIPRIDMMELSMGMSTDFRVAIEEGATLIRIGTLIFGERK
jgi:PLP dependent protein